MLISTLQLPSEYGVDGRVTKKITSGENYQYELAGNFAVTDISKVKI